MIEMTALGQCFCDQCSCFVAQPVEYYIFRFLTDTSIFINSSYEVDMDRFALERRGLKPSKSTLGRRRLLVNFILDEQLLSSLTKNVPARPEYPESHGFITLSCHLAQEHPAQQRW